jgi:hypothetical protein
MIELIALVLEDSCLREDGKAVGKTLWDEEQMQYRWPFFNVYANFSANKVDKEHHTSMESCMKPQKVMPAYHDAFSKETDPQLLNLDALPQNMRDAGLL